MNKIAIAVHGGAGPDSAFIQQHSKQYKEGLTEALAIGYQILEAGGTSMDAVEKAVNYLEDNPLFNAGRGSALNEKAEVQMDASIMNGKDAKAGAVCLVKSVKNPVTLARAVMEKTPHIYLGESGALELAQALGLPLMPDAYFITDHAFEQYLDAIKEAGKSLTDVMQPAKRSTHGTVGAVAVDSHGNVAAATSTGGTENKMNGRIGDSSIIGSGCFADNKTCAVSSTGDGEVIMQQVVAFHVAGIMQYKGLPLKEACSYLINEVMKEAKGDVGFIAIDAGGNIALQFNSDRMHRGYKTADELYVGIYPD